MGGWEVALSPLSLEGGRPTRLDPKPGESLLELGDVRAKTHRATWPLARS